MKRCLPAALLLATCILPGAALSRPASADWLTLPGTYSHDPLSGQRVAQFAPIDVPTTAAVQPLRSSGYTHYRSSLAYGQSADNYHKVQQWGEPVRPYGEWQFPYRPYSTPYPNWGAPYAGLNFNNNFYGSGGGGGHPGRPPHHPHRPGQPPGNSNGPGHHGQAPGHRTPPGVGW